MSWDETLMCFLGGVSFACLVVSLTMASRYRDRSVLWTVLAAACASSGVTTLFWRLYDLAK